MAAASAVGEPVGLVEDDDRALSLADQGRQRLVFGADQVVVEDENQEIGARGQIAGFALALGAGLADLRQARRVGQEDGPLDPFQRVGVVLGPLGRSHHRLGLAGIAAQEGVDQRRLAGRAGAEDDDVKLAAFLAGLDLAQFPVQPGPGRLIRHLPDHFSGVLRLNGRGLDHVFGSSNRQGLHGAWFSRASGRPRAAPTASRTIKTIKKGETQAPRMLGEPVVELGRRAQQPGRQAQAPGAWPPA